MKELEEALQNSWSAETCYRPCKEIWNPDNPALGQCTVTSLIVQDKYGGELLYCEHADHVWNRLPSGKEVDWTRQQFPPDTVICIDAVVTRHFILHDADGKARYELLKSRVNASCTTR